MDGDPWVDSGRWIRSTCLPSHQCSHWLGWFPLPMTVGSLFLEWQGFGSFPVVPCSICKEQADWRHFLTNSDGPVP